NISLCLSSFSNRVCHSTFESLRLGRSSQSIASGFLRFWDPLNFNKERKFVEITVLLLDEKLNSMIHGFTPVGHSIVKGDRFQVARCSSMYKITDHPFLIRFTSLTIIDEVITGAPEINLQSGLDCSTISKVLTSPKKQLESLFVSSLIKKQTQSHQEIQKTIPTNTKAATTSPPAHSSCLMKIAYMLNVNMPMVLSSYEKYIYSFKIH
ncbi:hypothetical protein IGI04_023566, partial [Brassica rapa subsp. trilocularis]